MLYVSAYVTTQKPPNFVKYDIELFYQDCVTLCKFQLN